jgi:hypothetical protein
MSAKNSPGSFRTVLRPRLSSAAVALELLRVQAELKRRSELAAEFRRSGYEHPTFADMTLQLREELPTPVLDQALGGEEIQLPAAAVPYCLEVHRRIRRIPASRRRWEHLLHHETVILLASVSVQRALNVLFEIED